MNSPGKKVLELAEITALLKANKCAHYKYDDVLEYLNVILASSPSDISFQEELTLEHLLVEVFYREEFNPANEGLQCNGCNYASLIIEVLKNRKYKINISIVSILCKTLQAGKFKDSFIDKIKALIWR